MDLSRDAREVDICINVISGSINLQTLPRDLKVLQMCFNHLTGKISLRFLPESLKKLNLMGNRFRKHVVYYAHLHQGIEKINLPTKVTVQPIWEEFEVNGVFV